MRMYVYVCIMYTSSGSYIYTAKMKPEHTTSLVALYNPLHQTNTPRIYPPHAHPIPPHAHPIPPHAHPIPPQ